jgi:hypothetical protein
MNILDTILNANEGAAVQQLGSQFGLGADQTSSALSTLVPALAAGFQRNMQSPDGLNSLLGALAGGSHDQYLANPQALGNTSAVDEGNGILGHVFGNKDVSRQVASRAAMQTGLSADLMKQMLPIVATMMMGAFARQSGTASAAPGSAPMTGGGLASMLGPLLDRNRDGSIVDDVTGMLGGFFRQ